MEDSIDLPDYCNFVVLEKEDPRSGVIVYRAHGVNNPANKVIIKATTYYSEENNNALNIEYELLVRLGKLYSDSIHKDTGARYSKRKKSVLSIAVPAMIQERSELYLSSQNAATIQAKTMYPIPKVFTIESMFDDTCYAIIIEDFEGMSLRKFYPKSRKKMSVDSLSNSASNSNGSVQLVPPIPQNFETEVQLIPSKLIFEEILIILTRVSEAIDFLHQNKTAYLGINPENVLVKKNGNSDYLIQLSNFTDALKFEQINQSSSGNSTNYAYVSPEQTGRIDKIMDYRSDMYSFGIMMWEMLTGQAPFDLNDPAELIYAHIAKDILDPRTVNCMIPEQIALIAMKLVRKNPSERYQLFSALKFDLIQCHKQILQVKKDQRLDVALISFSESDQFFKNWTFVLGEKDFCPVLQISSKTYGRVEEMNRMVEIYEKWCSEPMDDRTGSLIGLVGTTGTGKRGLWSDLIEYTGKYHTNVFAITAHISYCDSEIAFVGFKSLLEQLIQMILSESNEVLNIWEDKLVTQIGTQRLSILHCLVPSIIFVIPTIEISTMRVVESNQLVLYQSVQFFLQLFASEDQPLLICLDNLQYGPGSIEMLSYLLNTDLGKTCFFVGYLGETDIATDASNYTNTQRVIDALNYPAAEIVNVSSIRLNDVLEFLNDVLSPRVQDTTALARFLLSRCVGNQLFLKEIVKYCEQMELIKFDQGSLNWTWDLKKIENEVDIPSSAAALMMKQIEALDSNSIYILRCAACVGKSFDVKILSQITSMSSGQIHTTLNQAVASGYLIYQTSFQSSLSEIDSVGSTSIATIGSTYFRSNSSLNGDCNGAYTFCRGIMYEQLQLSGSKGENECISLQIARLLRYSIDEKAADQLCDLIKHYNNAINLLFDDSERLFVAQLNFQAASRFAYAIKSSALDYLKNSLHVLSLIVVHCEEDVELKFMAQYATTKLYLRSGLIHEAELIVQNMRVSAFNDPRLSKIIAISISLKVAQSKPHFEIFEELSVLSGINFYLSSLKLENKTGIDLLKTIDLKFSTRSIQTIVGTTRDNDEMTCVIDEMFQNCIYISHVNRNYDNVIHFTLLACGMILEKGFSIKALEWLGSVLPIFLGLNFEYYNFERAKFLGEVVKTTIPLASNELKVLASLGLICGNQYFGSYSDTCEIFNEALIIARKENLCNLAYVAMIFFNATSFMSFGKALSSLKADDTQFKSFTTFTEFEVDRWNIMIKSYECIGRGVQIPSEYVVESDIWNLPLMKYITMMEAVIFSRDNRREVYESVKPYSNSYHGNWQYVDYLLVGIVLECDKIRGAHGDQTLETRINQNIEIMEMHFQYQITLEQKFKLNLAKAERAKYFGDINEASKNYEMAIDGAQKFGNLLFLAWGNELYAQFWLSISSKSVCQIFLSIASSAWREWGCEPKVIDLKKRFPECRKASSINTIQKRSKRSESIGQGDFNLDESRLRSASDQNRKVVDIDINTVLKVSNSITNETNLEILIDTIMSHLMSNTGATRAVFFINNQGSLAIQKILNSECIELIDVNNAICAPLSLLNFVLRTQSSKLYSDCPTEAFILEDSYIQKFQPKSILCCPIKHQNVMTGAIYLENRLHSGTFTQTRVNMVKSLMASASISIANAQLLKKNNELAQALKDLNVSNVPKYNVETPMQKVFDAINSIKLRFQPSDPVIGTLDSVLSTLMSDGLFAANLAEVNDKDGKEIDQDTKNWIESSLLMTNRTISSAEDKTSNRSILEDKYKRSASISPTTTNNPRLEITEINDMLSHSSDLLFNCFHLSELTDSQPLLFLTTHMLKKYRLNQAFNINPKTLQDYMLKIESSYNKLPYHNSIHATDVLQSVEMLLLGTPLIGHFTPLEIFSICIGSAIHDLDHPGTNNNFLVQTQHPLSIMYNDCAVLESHHVARAFEIAKLPGCNIFESLSADQYKQCRKMIISIVMATDLAQHFQFISKFKGKTSSASLKLEDDSDRHLVMEMAVKCGDLGNPAKTFENAVIWTSLVMEEFFRQGDRERRMGLPISKFMDREDTNISKCQIGFIDFLVAPLYDAWFNFSKTEYMSICLQNISENRIKWQAAADNPNVLRDVSAEDYEQLDQLLDVAMPTISFGGHSNERRSSIHSQRRYTYAAVENEVRKLSIGGEFDNISEQKENEDIDSNLEISAL